MPIRDALSRLKGKLKKGLGVGSKDQSPTLSSANLSTISIPAHPDPLPSSAPGQSDLITPPAQGVGNQSSTSTPTIKDNHGTGGVVLPENRLQAPLDDENSLKAPVRLEKDNQPTDHAPRDDHEQDCTAGLAWKGAKLLLQVVNASATVFPPLKSAIGGLNDCINIYQHANKGRKDYGHLLNRIDELLEELQGYLKDKEAMEMTRSVERVCCELDMKVKKLKAKLEGPSAKQWLKAVDAPDEITEYLRRIQQLLERLTLNATVHILKALRRQDEKMDKHDMERRLEKMSPALSATYNSAESDELKRRGCTTGTRQPQIKSLLQWAHASTAGNIYWVNGMAGTGKTTIAYSVCTELDTTSGFTDMPEADDHSCIDNVTKNHEISKLGASFFCSRSIPECRRVKNIIPTIAYQLARYSVPFHYALYQVLQSEPDVCTRALKIQYQSLIVNPLTMVQNTLPPDFIVVIDALDECENASSLGEILDMLLSIPDILPIRFLISSRPEAEISRRMEGRVNEQGKTRLVLHNLDADAVKSDIAVFVRRELQDIPLTAVQLAGLIQRCGVLFIYASTTCRFIRNKHRLGLSNEAVNAIIDSPSGNMESGDERAIDELYMTILTAALGDQSEMRPRHKRTLQEILETVLCAGEPMKLAAVAGLLGLGNAKRVDELLQPLRSVLNITESTELVTTLHASFPDFMFSESRSGKFYCHWENRNAALAETCLVIMDKVTPTFNICGLSSSYAVDEAVKDLDERAKKAISAELAYACRYWAIHLHLGKYQDSVVQPVRRFFEERLLVWMEVLNLTKQMRFGTSIMQHAERWCLAKRVAEDLMMLARDAGQFVSVYANHPMSQSTPHIYLSMLPFWPRSRPVSVTYMPRTNRMLEPHGTAIARRQPALLATWRLSIAPVWSISLSADGTRIVAASDDAIDLLDTSTGEGVLHVQEAQTSGVRTVAISPDGARVAFGSDSGAYILDVSTRRITELYPEQISEVLHVAFSPDGSRVAIGSSDSKAYICSAEEGDSTLHVLNDHGGEVNSVAFSPGGEHVASGADDSKIRMWDTKTGQLVGDPLEGHAKYVMSISYSSDGSHLASSFDDGTVQVWNLKTGQTVLEPIKGHSNYVRSVAFSPGGTFIASASDDRTIRLYDATTGQTILGPLQAHTGYVRSVIVTPDSARLFSCSDDGTIRLWNVQDRHVPDTQHPTVPREFICVRYSLDGSRVVSGSDDGAVCVWDVQTGDIVLGPLQGHTYAVWGVDYSPDGAYIASASWDSTLRIWSAQDGKDIHGPIQGHTGDVYCVRFSADSSLLVSGSDDRTVRIWDVQTGQQLNQPLRGHSDWVRSVAFSPNRSHVVSGSDDGAIRVWDIQTGQTVIGPLQGHERTVQSVEFSSDGSRILSGSWDKSIRIWDAVTGQSLLVFRQGHGDINSVGFSPDGGLVVSGSDDRTVCVWDAQSGQLMLTLDGHTQSVLSVQFSPDGSHVVSCSLDGTIRFWDVSRSMEGLPRIDHLTVPGRGYFVRYSPDGLQVVSGSYDGSLFVWKVTTGSMALGPLAGHFHTVRAVDYSPNGLYIVSASYDCPLRIRYSNNGKDYYGSAQKKILGVNCVRFSPDSSLLVLGLDDKSVHVWDVQHQVPIAKPFLGHSGAIWSVAFSPNEPHVVSGSDDCTIRVWDIQTGQTLVDPLQGHKRRVTSVEFSPDGSRILSCSWDRSIRTWDALTSQTILVFGKEHKNA